MTRCKSSSASSSTGPSLISRIRKALGRKDRRSSSVSVPDPAPGSASPNQQQVTAGQGDQDIQDASEISEPEFDCLDTAPAMMSQVNPAAPPRSISHPARRPSRTNDCDYQPVLCMAFRSHQPPPTRRPTPRPPSAAQTSTTQRPGTLLLPRLTAMGPKTPTSIIERERYLQPADRRNLDLAPYYNPLGAARSRTRGRARTPHAGARSWVDELATDDADVPEPPRYGDRRQSRRMRPDEMRVLEEQLERVLVEERLGRPPEYQRRTLYV
ncbi:hypothetical protein BCR44DRAFT_60202 [Catenaria anguillulae PL171]|uniref:Uncharacterized protein n=1 Tax=Catenaria anguillulae PL171 TaxID=765915 RepID=A0A1Y2HQ28_9FUNG|nr:hypothetical protein BCR44DRAFT_60202 [Catenaria anguillulae PL171]